MDLTFLLPAILFTLLAIILASKLFRNNSSSTEPKADKAQLVKGEVKAGLEESGRLLNVTEKLVKTNKGLPDADQTKCMEHESIERMSCDVAADIGAVSEKKRTATGVEIERKEESVSSGFTDVLGTAVTEEMNDPTSSPGSEHGMMGFPSSVSRLGTPSYPQTKTTESLDDWDVEDVGPSSQSLKYAPGTLRTSPLEKMMTREELEEEQRVQREQLAAIFQLLKENKETFGEVSEGDMQEQLKLYSI
ncbi:uncharacterized protein [Osmerus mordax]|uniref:uncharacterized protein n=1 Tax=Osmerus mordax TaxID=8014 RepID=UPI00350F72CC